MLKETKILLGSLTVFIGFIVHVGAATIYMANQSDTALLVLAFIEACFVAGTMGFVSLFWGGEEKQ